MADAVVAGATPGRAVNSKAILEAAHRLIATKGEQFTTQDLIKEAGVALQTFYRHYGGKDRLLVAVIGELINGHCEQLREQAEGIPDPVERFRFFIGSTVDGLVTAGGAGARFITSQHWRLQQAHPQEMAQATRPFTDLLAGVLEDGRATGQLAPRDVQRDAWLINNLVMSVFHHYAFAPDDPGIATASDDMWEFCLAAVGGVRPTAAKRAVRRRRG